MVVKLALANVRRSYKDFAIYFLTLMMGVAVFYAFNSITEQQAVLSLDEGQGSMIDLLGTLVNGVSVFIVIILGFLVVYASRFLIKRRNREFAIYLLLGMPKGTLLRITLAETIMVGAASVMVGLGLGLLISQALLQVTALLFVADVTGYSFFVAEGEMLKTVIVFLAIFALAMVFNVGHIMKSKLIDLMNSGRKNDAVLRSIPLSFVLFLISCGLIGVSYYLLSTNGLEVNPTFGLCTALVCVGTLLFFYSLSGFLLRLFQSIKRLYYRGLNMFTLRQVASRVNTTFVSMAIICMTLFLAITSVSGGVGMSLAIQDGMASQTRFDATAISYYPTLTDESASETSTEETSPRAEGIESSDSNSGNTASKETFLGQTFVEAHDFDMASGLRDSASQLGLPDFDSIVKDSAQLDFYASDLTYADLDNVLGSTLVDYAGSLVSQGYEEQPIAILPVSQYNHAMDLIGQEHISLNANEAVLNADSDLTSDYLSDLARLQPTLSVFGHDLTVKAELDAQTYQTTSFPNQIGTLIVPDEVVPANVKPVNSLLNVMYTSDPDAEKQWLELYNGVAEGDPQTTWPLNMSQTREEVFSQNIGLSTIVSYLAVYIGFVLVVACAAILAIQQLSNVSDNQSRYQLLYKLGAPRSMINGALIKQIAIAFIFPLLLGVAHAVCALQQVTTLVQVFGHLDIVQTTLVAGGAFLIVYGLYFLLTYIVARGMLREATHTFARTD